MLQTTTSYCSCSRTVQTVTKGSFIAKRNKCAVCFTYANPMKLPLHKFTFASRYGSVRTTLVARLHTQQFGACRNGDAAAPVGYESLAEDFLGDIAHLATI